MNTSPTDSDGLFSPEEWKLLMRLPRQFFVLVAEADGNLDQKEFNRFLDDVDHAGEIKNRLHREIMMAIKADPQQLDHPMTGMLNKQQTDETAHELRAILRTKMGIDEYHQFIDSLLVSAIQIARASGGGIFSGAKIDKDEIEVLHMIAELYFVEKDKLLVDL